MQVVIDNAVAVIVEPIADFGLGLDGADTNQSAVDAGGRSFCTDAIAGLPDARQVTFVDQAIAVVIEAIANLFTRPNPSRALSVAGQLSSLAYAERIGRGLIDEIGITRHIAGFRWNAFIDEAVAVVVDAVANLGLRMVRALSPLRSCGYTTAGLAYGLCYAGDRTRAVRRGG